MNEKNKRSVGLFILFVERSYFYKAQTNLNIVCMHHEDNNISMTFIFTRLKKKE